MQVSWPVPGVCRYPVDILASVRGLQVPCGYPNRCQGFVEIASVGDFLLPPACPLTKVTLWKGGLLCLMLDPELMKALRKADCD